MSSNVCFLINKTISHPASLLHRIKLAGPWTAPKGFSVGMIAANCHLFKGPTLNPVPRLGSQEEKNFIF